MKTLRNIITLLCCVMLSQSVMAQLQSVQMNVNGGQVRFGVYVEGLGEVILDAYGEVLRVNGRGGRHHHGRDVHYEYYSSFRGHEAGKIKSIGDVKFTYYSDFRDYESGKIKSIGGKSVHYYSDFRDYEAGKIKSVGGISLDYYSDFRDYEAGKIKSIGRYKYDYFSSFDGHHHAGRPKSGYRQVMVDGVKFIIQSRMR